MAYHQASGPRGQRSGGLNAEAQPTESSKSRKQLSCPRIPKRAWKGDSQRNGGWGRALR